MFWDELKRARKEETGMEEVVKDIISRLLVESGDTRKR